MSTVAISRKKPDEPGVVAKFFFYLFMILGALVSVFPFYWMFVVATNDKDAAFHIPPLLTPGTQFFDNFARVLERTVFFQGLDELGGGVYGRDLVRCVPLHAGGLCFCQV